MFSGPTRLPRRLRQENAPTSVEGIWDQLVVQSLGRELITVGSVHAATDQRT
jgi:hypothetical protein